MEKRSRNGYFLLFIVLLLLSEIIPAKTKNYEEAWQTTIKSKYFGDKTIEESSDIIELTAPVRAEDPALVPLQIISKIPQNKDHYIKTITLIIDNNPEPFSAAFHFTPDIGKADLAMRVRVNSYTNIRAIAELNDGALSMHKVFIKASGGCSAPLGADLDAVMQRLGKMKFRLDGSIYVEKPTLARLLISHPNITGMQMDQVSRLFTPAHYVKEVKISFNGKEVMTAETDIAISADPNFRFYFVPDGAGELKAEIVDNKGMSFVETYQVKP